MRVHIIDDARQEFNGVIYKKNSDGYYIFNKRRLHREVWEFFNGEIPKGYVVHHVDFDKSNNQIENLQCLTNPEHMKLHADISGITPPPHKEITRQCDYCGKNFIVREKTGKNHFCSESCASAYHYRRADNQETRICQYCGKEFSINKNAKNKCCSASCAQRLRFKGHSEKRICPTCGKEFETIASHNSICCSHKCASLLMWQTRKSRA